MIVTGIIVLGVASFMRYGLSGKSTEIVRMVPAAAWKLPGCEGKRILQ